MEPVLKVEGVTKVFKTAGSRTLRQLIKWILYFIREKPLEL